MRHGIPRTSLIVAAVLTIGLLWAAPWAAAVQDPPPEVDLSAPHGATITWPATENVDQATLYVKAQDESDWRMLSAEPKVLGDRKMWSVEVEKLKPGQAYQYFVISQGETAVRSDDYAFAAPAACEPGEAGAAGSMVKQLQRFLKDATGQDMKVAYGKASVSLDEVVVHPEGSEREALRIGSAAIKDISPGGDPGQLQQLSCTLKDISMQKDEDHRIAAKLMELDGFSLDAKNEAFAVDSGQLTDFSMVEDEETVKIASLTTKGLSAQDDDQIKASHLKGQGLDVNTDDAKVKLDDAEIENLLVAGKQKVSIGRFNGSGLDMVTDDATVKATKASGRDLMVEEGEQVKIGEFHGVKLAVKSDDGTEFQIGDLRIAGINIADVDKPNLGQDMELTISDLTVVPKGKEPFTLSQLAFKTQSGEKGFSLNIELKELETAAQKSLAGLLPPAVLAQLKQVTDQPLKVDVGLDFALDRPEQRASLNKLLFSFEGLADLQMAVVLSGVQFDLEKPKQSAQKGLGTAKLESIHINYKDDSLAKAVLKSQAEAQGMKAEDLQKALAEQVKGFAAQTGSQTLQKLAEPVARFLLDPQSLDIKVNPKEPVPVMSLAGIQPTDEALEPLNIQIQAN